MKNIIELRDELCAVFDQLKDGTAEVNNAREMVNAAGKIINTVRLELEYSALRKEAPVIEFLGGDEIPSIRAKSPIALPDRTKKKLPANENSHY